MFTRKTFAGMRRAGMGAGISRTKLSQAMLEILLQLPEGVVNLKKTIVMHSDSIKAHPVLSEGRGITRHSYAGKGDCKIHDWEKDG
jgi:hypothetical protein